MISVDVISTNDRSSDTRHDRAAAAVPATGRIALMIALLLALLMLAASALAGGTVLGSALGGETGGAMMRQHAAPGQPRSPPRLVMLTEHGLLLKGF